MGQVCRWYNIKIVFWSLFTLHRQLIWVSDQDPIKEKSNIIYQVPCRLGHFWIEKTKRAHRTGLREHKAATRSGGLEKSDHCGGCWNHLHQEDWDNIKVLDKVANNTTLFIKEALHICITGSDTLMNRDEGITISKCWMAILSHTHPIMSAASSSTHQWRCHPSLWHRQLYNLSFPAF